MLGSLCFLALKTVLDGPLMPLVVLFERFGSHLGTLGCPWSVFGEPLGIPGDPFGFLGHPGESFWSFLGTFWGIFGSLFGLFGKVIDLFGVSFATLESFLKSFRQGHPSMED